MRVTVPSEGKQKEAEAEGEKYFVEGELSFNKQNNEKTTSFF